MRSKLTDLQRLKEMGISTWQVRDPAFFTLSLTHQITLPQECKLLFISDFAPAKEETPLFGKILLSMGLKAEEAFFLPNNSIFQLTKPVLWCWFAGVEPQKHHGINTLHSCSLSVLAKNIEAKQALWRQIKQYAASSS